MTTATGVGYVEMRIAAVMLGLLPQHRLAGRPAQ
jgi:hypothetical protein